MSNIQLTPDQQKKYLVEMLVWFDKFAKEHNLTYFLGYGTLLGAVRHKGFIPWDDDIDLVMLRDDYERMIDFFKNEHNSRYGLKCWQLDKKYYFPYSKLIDLQTELMQNGKKFDGKMGLFLDIFPLDSGPSDPIKFEKRAVFFSKLNRLLEFKLNSREHQSTGIKGMVANLADLILRSSFIPHLCLKYYDKEEKKYNRADSDYLVSYPFIYNRKKYKKKWFEDSVQVCFEGKDFPGPSNYDAFLTEKYGDYMKLPPEEERIPHHYLTVYLNSRSVIDRREEIV